MIDEVVKTLDVQLQAKHLTIQVALSPMIAEGDQLHTGYLTMNVTQPPFNNPKRQAVNLTHSLPTMATTAHFGWQGPLFSPLFSG